MPAQQANQAKTLSFSEILASALKDNGRGVLVGTKTYGKGVVQEINRLPGGAAIHITVSRYLTPNGSDINKVGVLPDIDVKDRDEQMNVALGYLTEKIASLRPTKAKLDPAGLKTLKANLTSVAKK